MEREQSSGARCAAEFDPYVADPLACAGLLSSRADKGSSPLDSTTSASTVVKRNWYHHLSVGELDGRASLRMEAADAPVFHSGR